MIPLAFAAVVLLKATVVEIILIAGLIGIGIESFTEREHPRLDRIRSFASRRQQRIRDRIGREPSKRLKDVAGFKYVPKPLPMRNSIGAIIYYLFFASPNKTGSRIVEHIFGRYRQRGMH